MMAMALATAATTGCQTTAQQSRYTTGAPSHIHAGVAESGDRTPATPARMLVWTAGLSLEVWNVSNAVEEATALVNAGGGYVSSASGDGVRSSRMTIRIPAKAFDGAVAKLESLGEIQSKDVSGRDVTEEYVDIEARLKNKIVLRDRLQKLLEKAADVKDVLAIETELNRVQGDTDSMQARITLERRLARCGTRRAGTRFPTASDAGRGRRFERVAGCARRGR